MAKSPPHSRKNATKKTAGKAPGGRLPGNDNAALLTRIAGALERLAPAAPAPLEQSRAAAIAASHPGKRDGNLMDSSF